VTKAWWWVQIHLDTDLGGDTDDACALAMLLGWPGVQLVGITTTTDPGGRRAGYGTHCLQLAGWDDIPVAAGTEVSLTTLRSAGVVTDDERYWPTTIAPCPSPPGATLDLLDRSIQDGATVVAIGPYTNLALLEAARPGRLGRVPVVAMGDGRAARRRPACLGTGGGFQRAVRHPGSADPDRQRHQAYPGHPAGDAQGAPARCRSSASSRLWAAR
jgi:hypothetical protein